VEARRPLALLELQAAPGERGEISVARKRAAKRAAWKRQPEILRTSHRLYLGDARTLPGLERGTRVHLVVTSPPYWDLKQYKADHGGAQLGHVHDRKAFIKELGIVWENCFQLLEPGGRLCVVVGDVCRSRREYGRHLVEPLHAEILLQCQQIGFDPLAPIIWQKIANVVTEVRGNGSAFLGKPYEPNAIIKNDIEYVLLFRKPGSYRHPTQEQRDLSLIEKEDHRRWFQQVWNDIPGEVQRNHPAPFPVEVARRLIGMFSFVGDTVFDPFVGLGTTTIAAMQMYRSSVGYELEPDYLRLAKNRVGSAPIGSTFEVFGE
jgi:modification methylase